ncbi:hypothetical protein PIB30_034285 [Stylosanthes scabra]|uniref:RRM domain-containing protein n=1 Tax=Stylosanthes scabra TaxID=79078 RepID=A0ABU6ZAC2_9FABA|nr:hypothetical protein [Stylosanthes scabra]
MREESGVRGWRAVERGKHSEVIGLANGRDKGESGGGFVSDAWRARNGARANSVSVDKLSGHTIFMDNLPTNVTKRDIFKEFGKDDYIVDVYISRKKREKPDTNGSKDVKSDEPRAIPRNKELEVIWADEQKQRLQRSLLGVCVNPIDVREVMYALLEEWRGPRMIECRDLGPYKCLLTFDSPEIRDETMHNDLLLSKFDEIRPCWDIFWCSSRRVWLEIIGMPVCLWCVENFDKIARSWGKVVRFDDRAELSKSFSVAKVLIDCYQWEQIHEWISLKVDGRTFEVFVKEYGAEVYSVQSHPDLLEGTTSFETTEMTNFVSIVVESPVEIEESPASRISNDEYVDDPQLEAIMMYNSVPVQSVNADSVNNRTAVNGMSLQMECMVDYFEKGGTIGLELEWTRLDPLMLEAHSNKTCWSDGKCGSWVLG